MIAPNLRERVIAMRDEFSQLLDCSHATIDGELRVKLARAELILHRIGKLLPADDQLPPSD